MPSDRALPRVRHRRDEVKGMSAVPLPEITEQTREDSPPDLPSIPVSPEKAPTIKTHAPDAHTWGGGGKSPLRGDASINYNADDWIPSAESDSCVCAVHPAGTNSKWSGRRRFAGSSVHCAMMPSRAGRPNFGNTLRTHRRRRSGAPQSPQPRRFNVEGGRERRHSLPLWSCCCSEWSSEEWASRFSGG